MRAAACAYHYRIADLIERSRARAFVQDRTAWFADDDRPGPTERLVPGYALFDLSAGVTVRKYLEVRGLMRNTADEVLRQP